jgi:radical SAM protein (TIGR04043 family)
MRQVKNKVEAINSESVVKKKAVLQANGVRIPQDLIDELETKYNAPSIRSGRMVLCLKSPRGNGELIPAFIINGKRGSKSPLYMVKNDFGMFEVWKNEEKYTDVTLLPRPKFYDNLTTNGITMCKIAVIVGPGHLRSVVNQRCIYHQIGKPCKFCAVDHWWGTVLDKAPNQVAETVEAGVREGVVEHVSLTTATLNTKGKGLESLVETARLIRARVEVPIMIEFEPISDFSLLDSLLQEGKRAGITTASCNIECFDENIRKEVMPVKGKNSTATYVKTWEKCLDVFGKNDVFTVAIVGIGEDDESILRGVEMAATHGVMTFIVPHSPTIGAVYENMDAPTAERMISIYEQAVSLYEKYGLDIDVSQSGCVRGGGFSAIKDVARFGV